MNPKCEDCGNEMKPLLTSLFCEWCDGVVEEWENEKDQITEPTYYTGGFGFASASFNFFPNDDDDEDD